jgi:hypothetical protein
MEIQFCIFISVSVIRPKCHISLHIYFYYLYKLYTCTLCNSHIFTYTCIENAQVLKNIYVTDFKSIAGLEGF